MNTFALMGEFPRSILVYVGIDAVGDGLMKLPFLRALRQAFPQARITWTAGKGHTVFAGILRPVAEGLIDEVLDEADFGSRPAELLGPRPLAGRSFDLVIDTQRRLLTTLILRRVRHKRFISATAGFLLSAARPGKGWKRPPGMPAQLVELVSLASGRPAEASAPLTIGASQRAAALDLLPPGPRYVGLAPGAGGRYKCWPLENFIRMAQELKRQGLAPVVLLGPVEQDWIEPIRAALPDIPLPLQQAPETSPMMTIAVAARLGAALANDSGIGHMLAAADVPLLSLFGPTNARKFAPLAQRGVVLRAQEFGSESMDAIPFDAVMQALQGLLTEPESGGQSI